eukprot:XP_003727123.1 PREDICTED: histamine N-methyltransferase [Strongylocentrotus purpuratus]
MEMSGEKMRTLEMKPLVSDLDYYAEAYRVYAGFSGQKLKTYQKWTDDVFIPTAVDKLHGSFQGAEEFRILGIGSGGGEIDVCLLERLSSRYPSITNTVIEPSTEAITRYTALLQEKEANLQGVKTHFKQTTIQEFCAETKKASTGDSRPKFHFIHAIQSLYYSDDLNGTIWDMYEMLEEGGAMLIIMMTDDHILYRMLDNFPFLVGQKTPSTTKLSSKDITKALEQLGLAYTSHTVNTRTEASSCFNPESEDGNKVLDFLTNTVRFRDNAPPEICDKVLGFLRAICPSSVPDETTDEAREGVVGGEDKTQKKLLFIRDAQSVIVFRQGTHGALQKSAMKM